MLLFNSTTRYFPTYINATKPKTAASLALPPAVLERAFRGEL
jgi:hypothetical protein